MPFAFSQIDPRTQGDVSNLDVPLSSYLNAAWDEGRNNSMFGNVYKWSEIGAQDRAAEGRMLSTTEANEQYGMKGLQFDQPISEGSARLIRQNHQDMVDREMTLSLGSKSLLSARGLGGMATEMISGMMNPLDFGSMFMPFVGEEKWAEQAANMGRGPMRQGIARGLIPQEIFDKMLPDAPRVSSAIFHGAAWQGMAEIPDTMSKLADHEDITSGSILRDVATQGLLSGALHMASHAFGILEPKTRDAMANKAVNDYVNGDFIDVGGIARVDPNVVEQKLLMDKSAENLPQLRPAIRQEGGEIIPGQVGQTHQQIIMDSMLKGVMADGERGFVNQAGEFLNRDEAAKALGRTGILHSQDLIPTQPEIDAEREKQIKEYIDSSVDKNKAIITHGDNIPDHPSITQGHEEYDPNNVDTHLSDLRDEVGEMSQSEEQFHSHVQQAATNPLGSKNLLLSMHSDEPWPRQSIRTEPMNLVMPAAENKTGKEVTTMQMIKDGLRTATTRHWGHDIPKVGDLIKFQGRGQSQSVRVTEVKKIGDMVRKYMAEGNDRITSVRAVMAELSVHEGWTHDAMMRHWREGKTVNMDSHQVIFTKDLSGDKGPGGLYRSPIPGSKYLNTTEEFPDTYAKYRDADPEYREERAKLEDLEERGRDLAGRNEKYKQYQSSRFARQDDSGATIDRRTLREEPNYDAQVEDLRNRFKEQRTKLKQLDKIMREEYKMKTGKSDADIVDVAVNCIVKGGK